MTPDPIDDEFAQAVVDVAREMDAKRSWGERLQDAIADVRLLFAIIRDPGIRKGRGVGRGQ